MSDTMLALKAGLTTEGITMYLFWLGIVGMGAGSLYLFMMQSTLSATYKKVAIVAGIICAVACFHYYRMSTIYVESLANAITVADDGPGIAEADLPHVFERLYVAEHSPAVQESGSGLGLALVASVVADHGGLVEVDSVPGRTVFRINFPPAGQEADL